MSPDDETVSGLGCEFAEPPQDDTVDASIGHSGISNSNSGTSSFDFQLDWHNSTLIDTTVSDNTKSEIEEMLDGGELEFGEYELVLGVIAKWWGTLYK